MMLRSTKIAVITLLVGVGLWSASPRAGSPKLHLFYAVHAHALAMEGSSFDTSLVRLDRTAARHLAKALVAVGDTLEGHGARASFQLTEATLRAVCTVAGPGVLQGLDAEGHDIGVHGHDPSEIVRAAQALQSQCGLTAKTGSGLVGPGTVRQSRSGGMGRPPRGVVVGPSGGGGAGLNPSVFASGALDAQRSGLQVLTLNATPTRSRIPAISRTCNRTFGANGFQTPTSGALPLAWRPNLAAGDICGDSPSGSLVLLDHAPGDWLLDPQGSGRDGVDLVGDNEFALLKPLLQAALAVPRTSGRVASWGFVSHLHEFMPGRAGASPASRDSLAAFDRWLNWVDRTTAGQATWSTPPQIASKVR